MKHALIINSHQFYEGISTGKLHQSMADIIHPASPHPGGFHDQHHD
ncbi:hypothetical protein [Undibacterium sp. Ji50W]